MRKPPSAFDSLSLEFFKRGEELEAQFLREAREALDESAWWEPDKLAEGSTAAKLPRPPIVTKRTHRWPLLALGGIALLAALGAGAATLGGASTTSAGEPATPTTREAPTAIAAQVPAEAAPRGATLSTVVQPAPARDAPAVAAGEQRAEPSGKGSTTEPPRPSPAVFALAAEDAVSARPAAKVERKNERRQRVARKPVRNRKRAVAHYRSGAAAFKRGDMPGARRAFRAAVQADDRYAPAYRGLGLVDRRARRATSAVRAFRTYLRLAPQARDRRQVEAVIRSLE